jgi:hypothetical protein
MGDDRCAAQQPHNVRVKVLRAISADAQRLCFVARAGAVFASIRCDIKD